MLVDLSERLARAPKIYRQWPTTLCYFMGYKAPTLLTGGWERTRDKYQLAHFLENIRFNLNILEIMHNCTVYMEYILLSISFDVWPRWAISTVCVFKHGDMTAELISDIARVAILLFMLHCLIWHLVTFLTKDWTV